MTELELFKVLRKIVIDVTGVPECIMAEQSAPAPEGAYAMIESKQSISQRGQANIIRKNVEPPEANLVEVDVRAQLIAEMVVKFFREDTAQEFSPFDLCERLKQCNKRPDISAHLFTNKVGWQSSGPVIDLTGIQSINVEARCQMSIFLMYENTDPVEINNILKVPYDVETIIDDEVETLASGTIE